jgi:SMC interacting uncharacterized protein involved in chromosome segregation
VSWARDAITAIKRIILIEDRIASLSKQTAELMQVCKDLDRRLVRIEAKFELLERMASPRRRPLPEETER